MRPRCSCRSRSVCIHTVVAPPANLSVTNSTLQPFCSNCDTVPSPLLSPLLKILVLPLQFSSNMSDRIEYGTSIPTSHHTTPQPLTYPALHLDSVPRWSITQFFFLFFFFFLPVLNFKFFLSHPRIPYLSWALDCNIGLSLHSPNIPDFH